MEEVLGGEAGDDGVFAVGELGEAVEGHLDVVLGGDLELLGDELAFEGAVVLVLGRLEEVFGLVFGHLEGGEEVVESGGGGALQAVVEFGDGWEGVGSARRGGWFACFLYGRQWRGATAEAGGDARVTRRAVGLRDGRGGLGGR